MDGDESLEFSAFDWCEVSRGLRDEQVQEGQKGLVRFLHDLPVVFCVL